MTRRPFPQRLDVDLPTIARRTGRGAHLIVAAILDEFSWSCLTPEATFVPLTPTGWRSELLVCQPDLLLVESAWRGFEDSWRELPLYRVPGPLIDIVHWCRQREIPTVFWNKEDPVHFSTYLGAAAHFDVVATTDVDSIPRYRRLLGHDRIHLVPFAAQPCLHNPFESFERIDGTAFAGAYYATYPDRNRDFDMISPGLLELGQFDIYDRNFASQDPGHRFPDRYQAHIVGSLKPSEIDVAYKGYEINLNLNSVRNSQTMFARRVFEVLASNTLLVSNYSRALRTVLGDLVVAGNEDRSIVDRLAEIDASSGGRVAVRAAGVRTILQRHTYARRLELIATHAGLPLPPAVPARPVVLARVDDDEDVASVLASAAAQDHAELAVVLVASTPAIAERAGGPGVRVSVARDEHEALQLARTAQATHLLEFSPADCYGQRYVSDLLLACGTVASARAGYTDAGDAWRGTATIPLARAAIGAADWTTAARLLAARDPVGSPLVENCAVWGVPDLRERAGRRREPLRTVPIDDGTLRAQFVDALATGLVERDPPGQPVIRAAFDDLTSHPRVTISGTGAPTLESMLAADEHAYVYSRADVPLASLGLVAGFNRWAFECTAQRVAVQVVLIFRGIERERVGDVYLLPGDQSGFEVPATATSVRLAVRVQGPGSAGSLRMLTSAPPEPAAIIALEPTLFVSSAVPVHEDGTGSAVMRLALDRRRYRGRASVLELTESGAPSYRDHLGVDVVAADAAAVGWMMRTGQVDEIIVSGSDRKALTALRGLPSGPGRFTIWIDSTEHVLPRAELIGLLPAEPGQPDVSLAFPSRAVAASYWGDTQYMNSPATICSYDPQSWEIRRVATLR